MSGIDQTLAQWDSIYDIIKTETAVGGRLNGVAWTSPVTNNSGTVTVADVRKGAQLWSKLLPAIGVQADSGEDIIAGGNRHDILSQFRIILCTQSTPQTVGGESVDANLDDAMAQLQALLSDGQGNGLTAIFRDPNTYRLNDTTSGSRIKRWEFSSDVGEGATPQIFAYCTLFLEVGRDRITMI